MAENMRKLKYRLMDLVREFPGETSPEIFARLQGVELATLSVAMRKLHAAGVFDRHQETKLPGKPYRYYLGEEYLDDPLKIPPTKREKREGAEKAIAAVLPPMKVLGVTRNSSNVVREKYRNQRGQGALQIPVKGRGEDG